MGAKGAADAALPTDEDRCKLARQLSRARMEDVTAAVHEIDRHCPDALVRNGDTIDVDVDRLNAWTFCSVERVVAPQAASGAEHRAADAQETTGYAVHWQ